MCSRRCARGAGRDRPALTALPASRFTYGEWKGAKVNDHVEVEGHYYSVPYQHLGDEVEVRISAATIEVILDGQRIASHVRRFQRGRHTTVPEHMPLAHRQHLEWSPLRLMNWAGTIGPQTRLLVTAILEDRYGNRSAIMTSQLPTKTWHAISLIRPSRTPSSIAYSTTPIGSC